MREDFFVRITANSNRLSPSDIEDGLSRFIFAAWRIDDEAATYKRDLGLCEIRADSLPVEYDVEHFVGQFNRENKVGLLIERAIEKKQDATELPARLALAFIFTGLCGAVPSCVELFPILFGGLDAALTSRMKFEFDGVGRISIFCARADRPNVFLLLRLLEPLRPECIQEVTDSSSDLVGGLVHSPPSALCGM